ncbi:Endonuclease/exonuclease/phosphatase [Penicillium verrucosum]|uniref:Endonuclease/exonuclease/phosphatase n=1 Tax=Penicillium verrucosum TaxID=60171 RepID=UPI002544EE3C|nr:Endonuclease/exonuclease/phosphatase [Penicillium verrucosum]KAJ5942542.1 Endonuclease/exonuclease/phosphatase [Penicillium verrucosum]
MVRMLGPAHLFVTFSTTDLHWDDLMRSPSSDRIEDCEITWSDREGRAVLLRFSADKAPATSLMAVYAPNVETEKVAFWKRMALISSTEKPDIILGDLNTTLDPIDRNPVRVEDLRVRKAFQDFITIGSVVMEDGWRETYPDTKQYTWWGHQGVIASSRIDRIYVTPSKFDKCLQWWIEQTPGWTDHSMPVMDFCPEGKVERGKGQWYMNANLFNHAEMRAGLRAVLDEWLPKLG